MSSRARRLRVSLTCNFSSETSQHARTAEQSHLHFSLAESSQHVRSPWELVSEPSGSEHWTPAVSPVSNFALVFSFPVLRVYYSARCLLTFLLRRLGRLRDLTFTLFHLLKPAWLIQGAGQGSSLPKLSLTSPLPHIVLHPRQATSIKRALLRAQSLCQCQRRRLFRPTTTLI